MSIIRWLNDNQGFVMSLLTMIYVAATLTIVIYNRKTINEMKASRDADSRPYVFIHLDKDPRDPCFYMRIKNYGKSSAIINHVKISPNIKLYDNALPENFLKNVVLAPSQMLEFIVLEMKNETVKNEYLVNIQYSATDTNLKQYREAYTLKLQYALQMGYSENSKSGCSDEQNSLRKIANNLDAMRRKL